MPSCEELDLLRGQYRELLANPKLSREECEVRFPELIAHVKAQVSLLRLLREEGYKVKPLSPDAPGVFMAEGACPDCGADIIVKE